MMAIFERRSSNPMVLMSTPSMMTTALTGLAVQQSSC
jgi:hypothetical protein